MGALILAVRFLTILPVPGREATGPGALGRAAWWFPVVGLALGAGLAALDRGVALVLPPLLAAVVLVAAWKVASGGIHLDGLADCLDGLAGPTPERRLAIMRDSRVGVFGACGLIAAFLVPVAAVSGLPDGVRGSALILAPAVGRLAPVLIGPWFRAATPGQGMGAPFLLGLPRAAGPLGVLVVGALAAALLGHWGVVTVALPLVAAAVWAGSVARRLRGMTGDVLGSAIELAESGVLVIAAALAHRGAA